MTEQDHISLIDSLLDRFKTAKEDTISKLQKDYSLALDNYREFLRKNPPKKVVSQEKKVVPSLKVYHVEWVANNKIQFID